MRTSRLEAFSDGVLAIIITIMVLELAIPEGEQFTDLLGVTGSGLLSYLLSFIYVGIYWNNHHHLFQLTKRVSGPVLWANLHLLFWLSLFPFTTAWMDSSGFARAPVMTYGIVLLAAATAYALLQRVIMASHPENSSLRDAIGRDTKAKVSLALYLGGVAAAWFIGDEPVLPTVLAAACYVAAALLWFLPDKRIERAMREHAAED
ncbi:TMEM175 family protein [Agrococcus sp. Ld7]|uniref:TMEM175 family protein n=1 Tax=Agrococcus sp. Ld7 TaxID=649148 RepID=UPI0038707ABC